jgi:hypothetical protein
LNAETFKMVGLEGVAECSFCQMPVHSTEFSILRQR